MKCHQKASQVFSKLVLVRRKPEEEDFLTLNIHFALWKSSRLLLFRHTSKSTTKSILPSLPFLPMGLNDAVKILFYYKSFHWMTPWHYRTLEPKQQLYTTDPDKYFSFNKIYKSLLCSRYFLYWMLRIKVHKHESSVFQQILCSPTYKRTRIAVIVFLLPDTTISAHLKS